MATINLTQCDRCKETKNSDHTQKVYSTTGRRMDGAGSREDEGVEFDACPSCLQFLAVKLLQEAIDHAHPEVNIPKWIETTYGFKTRSF